jgi:hypothetical protein
MIELLENSELTGVAGSRIINKNFIDNYSYSRTAPSIDENSNFLGALFGLPGVLFEKKVQTIKKDFIKVESTNIMKSLDDPSNLRARLSAYLNSKFTPGDSGDKDAVKNLLNNPANTLAFREYLEKRGGLPSDAEGLRAMNAEVSVYASYPLFKIVQTAKSTDAVALTCEEIKQALDLLEIDIEKSRQDAGSGTKQRVVDRWLSAYNERKGEYSKMYSKMDCQRKAEQAILDADKADTLNVLAGAAKDNNNGEPNYAKYALYGIGGIFIIGTIIYILK